MFSPEIQIGDATDGLAPAQRWKKTLLWAERLLLAAAIALLVARTLPRAWNTINTDFPNYYIAARLVREHRNTDRLYEWEWIQSQKNRLGIDQPLVGFIPLTPVSALPMIPFANLAPIAAKHVWIIFNIALLLSVTLLLRSVSGLALRHIWLLSALSLPVHQNLILGQAYILLLALFVSALWLYTHQHRVTAGAVLGIAFGLKLFPVLFLLYFLRKRDWRGTLGLVLGAAAMILLSLAVFGIELNRTYAMQVLPWALRGEALSPYNLQANSLSAGLHRLFIFEPQWNPHPIAHLPVLVAILHPLLQVAIFAPALWAAIPGRMEPRRLRMEWSVYILALLTISTSPGLYDFAVLLLPATVFVALLKARRNWRLLVVFAGMYFVACYPPRDFTLRNGWQMLFCAPRLYALMGMCALCCALSRETWNESRRWQAVWVGILAAGVATTATLNVRHQRGLFDDYRCRVEMPATVFAAINPTTSDNSERFTAMQAEGYRSAQIGTDGIRVSHNAADEMGQAITKERRWWSESGMTSQIFSTDLQTGATRLAVNNAGFPVVSRDGHWLAFLRDEHGVNRLWLRNLSEGSDRALTSPEMNVYEMTFTPDDAVVFSGASHGHPRLYTVRSRDSVRPVSDEEARYPAISPDGSWLAFSRLQRGNWSLWLREIQTGTEFAVTTAECNATMPAWKHDSMTLLYASDCGRGLWLPQLCRRKVLP